MRITWGSLLVIVVACSKPPAGPSAQPPVSKPAPVKSDTAFFPASWPALRDAQDASEPARKIELAHKAIAQLTEEKELSTQDADHEEAYARLVVRMRIVADNGLVTSGRSLDALADVAREPLTCPTTPAATKADCDSLFAALATGFPNVVTGPGRVAQVDQSKVVDEPDVAAFVQKATALQGSVVQRMRVTSAKPGLVKIGAQLQLHVGTKDKLSAGEVVWVAFEPRNLKQVGNVWDLDKAHLLFVEKN